MSIDTTPSFIPSLNQRYMESILGQRTPFDLRDLKDDSSLVVTPPTSTTQDLQSSLVLFSILQADSLWSQGDSAKSREILLQSRILRNDNGTEKKNIATGSTPLYLMHFARGLMQLLDGALILAYESFTNASKNAPREELVSVFLAERAANIAFWLACTGKMDQATAEINLDLPYAGGIRAFAEYMSGDMDQAETTARQALRNSSNNDPWTIHAVVHVLYARGESEACIKFLDECTETLEQAQPSMFMRGHMQFHRALCLVDLRREETLVKLIVDGAMWGSMSSHEKGDYWTATGLLNVIWKAELHGLRDIASQDTVRICINQALHVLFSSTGEEATKSLVFSLCILRWTSGADREEWQSRLMASQPARDNHVYSAMVNAIHVLYASTSTTVYPTLDTTLCTGVAKNYVLPIIHDLYKLGASPEQREVIEDFCAVVAKNDTGQSIDLVQLVEKTRRTGVPFYDDLIH